MAAAHGRNNYEYSTSMRLLTYRYTFTFTYVRTNDSPHTYSQSVRQARVTDERTNERASSQSVGRSVRLRVYRAHARARISHARTYRPWVALHAHAYRLSYYGATWPAFCSPTADLPASVGVFSQHAHRVGSDPPPSAAAPPSDAPTPAPSSSRWSAASEFVSANALSTFFAL